MLKAKTFADKLSIFKNIDLKLEKQAERLGAKLHRDRPGFPPELLNFEERRIDWVVDGINKAIIIQPVFTASGIDPKNWNFRNIAWFDDARSTHRPKWIELLIEKKSFETIESAIDDLLARSERNLANISMKDLK